MASFWLVLSWEIRNICKIEDESNLNSGKDLKEESLKKFYKLTKNKSSNAFLKLRELRSENTKHIISNYK